DGLYSNNWSQGEIELHFVNIPAKDGDAWVFPVGLKDAVWFAFKNPNITIVPNSSVEEALTQVGQPNLSKRVLVFEGDGSLTEVITVVYQGRVFYRINDMLVRLDRNNELQEVGPVGGQR